MREIVYGLRKEPYIAVRRIDKYGLEYTKTAWMHEDNIASWTFNGYEGKPCIVDVYCDAEEVELLLNGVSKGKKTSGVKVGFITTFETEYENGTLEALAYRNGIAQETMKLITADSDINISAVADREIINANGADLSYITVNLKDKNGNVNMNIVKNITVKVEGVGRIQGFGSANPETLGQYDDLTWETWDGYLLCVVRAGYEEGNIKVTFSSDNLDDVCVIIEVKK